jgi:hypothetical protein
MARRVLIAAATEAYRMGTRWITFASSLLLAGAVACGGPAGEPIGSSTAADSANNVTKAYTISYAPNSYVIGNVYPGWTDVLHGASVFGKGPGNPDGSTYQCGYLYGESFDHCGWIGRGAVSGTADSSACGTDCPGGSDQSLFVSTYTNGTNVTPGGDGSPENTHMHYSWPGCTDKNGYANVSPWLVPAKPDNSLGPVPDGKYLQWRYVTKDNQWVLVLDPSPTPGQTNWYYVSLSCISLDDAAPPAPPPPAPCGEMLAGDSLAQGQSVTSCNGAYTFVMQGDGNLVQYQGTTALWATMTNGKGGYEVDMQSDGNLVLYTSAHTPLWATNTSGHPGAFFAVQDDSNIVLYDGTTPLWARFGLPSSPPPPPPPPPPPAPPPSPPPTPTPPPAVHCCAQCNDRVDAYHADASGEGCGAAAKTFCSINGRGGVDYWYEGDCPEAP